MATIPNQTGISNRPPNLPPPSPSPPAPPGPVLLAPLHRTRESPLRPEIVWELRDAIIQDFKGKTIFPSRRMSRFPPTGP